MKRITADYVRKNFPTCVAVADMVRSEFGDGVKMIYARENGKTIGKQTVTDGHSVNLSDMVIEPSATEEDKSTRGKKSKNRTSM